MISVKEATKQAIERIQAKLEYRVNEVEDALELLHAIEAVLDDPDYR